MLQPSSSLVAALGSRALGIRGFSPGPLNSILPLRGGAVHRARRVAPALGLYRQRARTNRKLRRKPREGRVWAGDVLNRLLSLYEALLVRKNRKAALMQEEK